MKSSQMLKEVHSVMVVNLADHVNGVMNYYADALIPPPKGIYLLNGCEPVLTDKVHYYTRQGLNEQKPLTQLDGLNEAVYSLDGETIIPEYVMRRKDKFLRAEPIVPVIAMKLGEIIVKQYIDSMLPYTEAHDYDAELRELVKPEFHHLITDGKIEALFRTLVDRAAVYVGVDVWNIYTYTRNGLDLYIQKGIDFRIYDWTVKQEDAAQLQLEE